MSCAICDHDRPSELRQGLVHWRPPYTPEYQHIVRCRDEAACRARVEAAGHRWPVVERRVRV